MDDAANIPASIGGERLRVGRPPIPREHGAWVILYAPLVIGFAVERPFSLAPALLLTVAVTGAYLARNASDIALRRRDQIAPRFWLAVYLLVAAAGSIPLLALFECSDLLAIGAIVAVLFAVHASLSRRRSTKRFDRTAAGELLAVAALVSTAPAAVVVLHGSPTPLAWQLWLLCALFFGSGVLHVNMYLEAVKLRGRFGPSERDKVSRASLTYHVVLCTVFPAAAFLALGSWPATALASAGTIPAILRAFAGVATVSPTLPPLKRVGWQESAYSLWFTACLIAAFIIR